MPPSQQPQGRMPQPLGLFLVTLGESAHGADQVGAPLDHHRLTRRGGGERLKEHKGAHGADLHWVAWGCMAHGGMTQDFRSEAKHLTDLMDVIYMQASC